MPSPLPLASAWLYARPEALLVLAQHVTTDGIVLAGLPAWRLPADVSPEELGAALEGALAGARRGVPTPARDDYSAALRPVREALGYASWSALEHRSRACDVLRMPTDEYVFVPQRNNGSRGAHRGFRPVPNARLALAGPLTRAALGAAALQSVRLSEVAPGA